MTDFSHPAELNTLQAAQHHIRKARDLAATAGTLFHGDLTLHLEAAADMLDEHAAEDETHNDLFLEAVRFNQDDDVTATPRPEPTHVVESKPMRTRGRSVTTGADTLTNARRHIGAALRLARAAGILAPAGITSHLARAEQLLQEHHFHDQSVQEILDGLQDAAGPKPVEGFTTARDAVVDYLQRLTERGDQP